MATHSRDALQRATEEQCVGKSFWKPSASRRDAEEYLKKKPPGSFLIRRSSKVRARARHSPRPLLVFVSTPTRAVRASRLAPRPHTRTRSSAHSEICFLSLFFLFFFFFPFFFLFRCVHLGGGACG